MKSPKANRAELLHSAAPYAHEQVRTTKQHVEPIHVPGNSAISCLAVSELPLHDQEWMFHLAPDRRLLVFDDLLPVDSFVVRLDVQ